jgi:site-specific DNA-cytosine methylase
MKFGSVCSGIEAASVAWHPLGWQAAWLSEIEPFPSAVLAHHYPTAPNLGDMTALPKRILSGEVEAPDLFCGGTPCQAFSVAGLRQSLDDDRGNLSLTFVEIANAIDNRRLDAGHVPAIIFWENVPGVLNTKDNAFGCFLGALAGEDAPLEPAGKRWTNAGCVYGPQRAVAWRVFDAQYFGVAQRRRRVFVVASAGEKFDPASVLFEFEGVRRDTAPRREAGERIAPCVTNGPPFSRTGNERVEAEAMVVAAIHAVSMAVRRLMPVECERLQGFPDGYTNIPWRKKPESPDGPRYKALGNSWAVPVVAWIGKRIKEQLL